MIEGLEERDRIKHVFGKAVSPTIAARLMQQAEDVFARRFHAAAGDPFSDIRNFTARTESSPPEMVITDLNAWFTEAVEAICDHDGVVDKFIGDGILAVFGLDGDMSACEKAVACAREMLVRLERLNPTLSAPIDIGIGIHKGEVLAGILGSPERLEFTVIGDVVNTASRIEGMTRRLDASVLISEAVKHDLEKATSFSGWKDFGELELRGKTAPCQALGAFGWLKQGELPPIGTVSATVPAREKRLAPDGHRHRATCFHRQTLPPVSFLIITSSPTFRAADTGEWRLS